MDRNKSYKAIGFAFLMAFSFGFFAPFNIYLSNISEFWFSPKILLPVICGVTTVLFLALGLIFTAAGLFSDYIYKTFIVLALFVSVALFVQGNFIVDKNGVLDGTEIDWTAFNSGRIISYVLWGAVILGIVFVVVKKKQEAVYKASGFVIGIVLLIEVFTLGTLLIIKHDFSEKNFYEVTTIDEFKYTHKNFIILILDTFDASYMNAYMNDETKAVLEDFTFFPDTMSVYGHTDLSLPQMLTGKKYLNETKYGDYLAEAYDNSPLLDFFYNGDWNIGLYTESIIPSGRIAQRSVNCKELSTKISSKRRFIKYIYQLVAYNYSPYDLKKVFWFYPGVLNDTKDIALEGVSAFEWSNGTFYSNMDAEVTDEERGSFKLYHLKGMHGPNDHDGELKPVTEYVSDEEMFKGNLLLVKDYLDKLRQSDIYDDSVIIILADHGCYEDESGRWNQNPLLLIKGYGEKHDFMFSDKRVSYDDLQDIYRNLLNGKDSVESVDVRSDDEERYFLRYDYDNERKEDEYFPVIREFITVGNANDLSAFRETGERYEH